MTSPKSRLAVVVDGELLPDAEARALWARFSDWMEAHRGDLAGFAAAEGLASIHPAVDNGLPVLIASKSASEQHPYASARAVRIGLGGSADRQKPAGLHPGRHRPAPKKRPKR